MQQIEFSESQILFIRAVKGAAGYSNFSLLDGMGNIFFHVSFRWEKGEAFCNTKVNNTWNKEVRVLRKLGNETSLVIRQGKSAPPEIIIADAKRVLRPATGLHGGQPFETSCYMDYQGDFEFITFVDTRPLTTCRFYENPQDFSAVTVAGRSRIVDRTLLDGGATAEDQYLCAALEATISAAELPKVERAALGTASLAFGTELLSRNKMAKAIELYGRNIAGLENTLKTNKIATDGLEFYPQKDFRTKALTADLIAGADICTFLPEDTPNVSVFSLENQPLPLPKLEKRIASNQRLHLRTRRGGWVYDQQDHRERGGLNCALDVCVAAYNSEEYLEECVRSILDTPSRLINAVIVNDGSTDGTEALAQKLAAEDDRIRVLSKPNGGCASARNYGRLMSNSSHIAFVDADDFVDPGFFEHLFNLALYSGFEIVQAGFMNYDHKTRISTPDLEDKFLSELNTRPFGELNVRTVNADMLLVGQPAIWRRVHRRDFLDAKKITFPENVRAFDDYYFQMRTLYAARDVLHIDGLYYRYRQHENQDIRKADARHFYELYMFRQLIKAALEEGWNNFTPLMNSIVNSINWTVSKLRNDLVGPFLNAAAEVVVVAEKALASDVLEKPVVERIHHPDFAQFYAQWQKKLADLPSTYWAGYVSYVPEHPLLIDWN